MEHAKIPVLKIYQLACSGPVIERLLVVNGNVYFLGVSFPPSRITCQSLIRIRRGSSNSLANLIWEELTPMGIPR